MRKTKILIADDHELVRRGIRALLQGLPEWEVVGEASTGRQTVEAAKQLEPDIIIMDVSMPVLNGLEATREIVKDNPGIEVLVVSMHESESLIESILAAGARGYLLKSDAGQDLIAGITALREHKPFFTSKVAEMVLRGFLSRQAGSQPPGELARPTSRERQVIQLVAEGRTNKEIAKELGLSVKTVESHRAHIMSKLGLSSVSDLVRYAIRNKIIES